LLSSQRLATPFFQVIWLGVDPAPLVATIRRLLRPKTGRALLLLPVGGRGAEACLLAEAQQQGLAKLATLVLPRACAGPRCPPATHFPAFNLTAEPRHEELPEKDAALYAHVTHALGSDAQRSETSGVKENSEDFHLHVFMYPGRLVA
jgi:hypothetical protein